jgi:acetyltransferase-like isoleucine patch superfamily enzyme
MWCCSETHLLLSLLGGSYTRMFIGSINYQHARTFSRTPLTLSFSIRSIIVKIGSPEITYDKDRGVFRNIKYRLTFREYGKDVTIAPNVVIKRPHLACIGNHVTIQSDTRIYIHPENKDADQCLLRVGNHVHIGINNVISARNCIVIEDYVLCAPRVTILDNTHHYEDIDTPIMLQDLTRDGAVHLGTECWIGTNAIIMPNVTIGKHAIIGANAVVTQNIPPFSVAVGAPATVIKQYDGKKKKWVRS